MIIRNNPTGMRVYNANRKTTASIKKNLEKLASGYRINRSADDAAGLSVSERMRAKITELGRCQRNAAEGIDLARTADAALQEVNDILKRARELCVQAENGTYGNQELAAISDELNQLFGEIDRISAGSCHNSINLFRQGVGHTFHEEYDEQFTPVGDDLQLWGELDFIQTADFERADPATPATATFKLSDDIDFNDINSLNGKAIRIGSYTYGFVTDSSVNRPTGVQWIYLDNYTSTKQALESLKSGFPGYVYDVQSVTVNEAERTVTLTGKLQALTSTVNADGQTLNVTTPNGDGEWKNGIIVSNPAGSASLQEVDGLGAANNKPSYSSTATGTITMPGSTGKLTQANVDNLKGNKLSVAGNTIELKDLNPTTSMTWDDFGKKLATKINSFNNCNASYANQNVTVTVSGLPTGYASSWTIYETTASASGGGQEYGTSWSSVAANLTIQEIHKASLERYEEYKVTVSKNLSNPFSVRIGNKYYLYYDSSREELTPTGYPYTEYSVGSLTKIDTNGKSWDDIMNSIAANVRSLSGVGSVTVSGNDLTVRASSINTTMNLNSNIIGVPVTVKPYKLIPATGGTSPVLLGYSTRYFQQEATVSFSLGSTFEADKLVGSGFSIASNGYTATKWEFTNGTGLNEYKDIDISSCMDFDSLAQKVQLIMGNTYTVKIDRSEPTNVKLSISMNRNTSSYSVAVTDGLLGIDGLIDGGPVEFGDGANTNHSRTAIDFSTINEDNLDTLLGKGFRIRCATCPGEYINVFFCWTKSGDIPLTFEKEDPTTGEIRTIHNVPVELSKITSGDKIVEDIVNQVRPSLKHYTDVDVGDPPTTLIAMEKRIGDVKDNAGNLYLGSVETGVEANFVYSVEHKTVQDPLEGDLDELKDTVVNIYVGSDPKAQYIPIHLPYIDLYHLRLEGGVDLAAEDQNAADWLGRIERADLAISSARGTIGADYNRLEHTIQELSNANIQLNDACSVIRDADMADLMMNQVKNQILLQFQQSMLSQANQMPDGVLQLMQ